jgi:hypothetical protein
VIKLKTSICFSTREKKCCGATSKRSAVAEQHKGRLAGRQAEQAGGRPKEVVAFYFARVEYFALTFCVGQKVFHQFKNQKVEKDKNTKC